jgi:hypothetical protein
MNTEYAQSSRTALGVLVLVLLIVVAVPFLAEPLVEYFLEYDPILIDKNGGAALRQELLRSTWVLGSLNFVYVLLGVAAVYLGARIIRARRFPPFGIGVPFRMRVRTGIEAVSCGLVLFLLGGTFLFRAMSFLIYWPWRV